MLEAGTDEALTLDPDELDDDTLAAALVALHRAEARWRRPRPARPPASTPGGPGPPTGHGRPPPGSAGTAGSPATPPGARCDWRAACARWATAAALGAGEVTAHHAHRLAALNRPELAEAFAEGEALLVDHARSLHWAGFARATSYWRTVTPRGRSPGATCSR